MGDEVVKTPTMTNASTTVKTPVVTDVSAPANAPVSEEPKSKKLAFWIAGIVVAIVAVLLIWIFI